MKYALYRNLLLVGLLLVTLEGVAQKKSIVTKANSQNTTSVSTSGNSGISQQDPEQLKKLEAQFRANFKRRKQEAIAYALVNNIPIKKNVTEFVFSEIQFITEEGTPVYYTTYNDDAAISTRTNYLNTGGGLGLQLNGDNLIAHVWDGGHARITHQEYDGSGGTNRVTLMDTAAEGGTQLNFHAAHVTGTITSSGQFQAASKGMAWQSNVHGYMWNDDVAEATAAAADITLNNGFGMLVSNHSYGFSGRDGAGFPTLPSWIFGSYYTDSRDWDQLMYAAPYYLMVVAAGNDGFGADGPNHPTGTYINSDPLDNEVLNDKLTGHSTSKNNLVVANGQDALINANGTLNAVTRNSSSSEGPTDDYRVKPDIMGNGTGLYSTYHNADNSYNSISGTSMASPNITGTLLLLQEHYYNLHTTFMRSATLRGLALHTADDAGVTGPDPIYGWGLMNAKKAAETITDDNVNADAVIDERNLPTGQSYLATIAANGTEPLVVSIVWTDPAGTVNTNLNDNTPVLVNDLDVTLSNGTTFYPWRMTGVNTNATTARNNVDNFEKIEISGATGQYTLSVTHDGPLSSGSQDYTLIITGGQIDTGIPQISFSSTTGNTIENSECGFTDVSVPVNITTGASANADVDFTINNTSTASSGIDFDLMTASITFPSGSTTSQNMVVRVNEDTFVEGDETVIIDFTVNPNGGDAVANMALDTYTLTITDDDIAPPATLVTNVFSADFESTLGWTKIDNDGDLEQWTLFSPFAHGNLSGLWAGSVTDDAVTGGMGGIFTPDNFYSSPQFTIPSGIISGTLTFEIGDLGAPENYTVYFTTDKTSAATIIAGTQLESRSVTSNVQTETRTIDVSSLAGQTGYLSFRHHAPHGDSLLMLDTVDVVVVTNANVQTAVNTVSPDAVSLNGVGTAYSQDTTTGNIMAEIINNQNDDYDCTMVSVSRAGTGAQAYNGSKGVNQVMDKRFTITPSNSVTNGDTTITFYMDADEITGWETSSGNTGAYTMYIARESGGTLEDIVVATVGSFGPHTTLAGNFLGTDGDFYFGRQEAFNSCLGVSRTWNGTVWTPSGTPTNGDEVFINGDYNTATHGNLDVCAITINSGNVLTVAGGNFLRSNSTIKVDGSLQVEHTGSVVQVNPTAQVIKNPVTGIINVHVTTPVLQNRDFMVMGSPMDLETRNGVFTNAFLVLDHEPDNFNPDPHPNIPQGATNFSDLEGDFWTTYMGAITPGEGYIVRPQTGYGDPANVSYDMTYSQGTLNNGTITKPKIYNNLNSPSGTPNVYANPYASAIDADLFIQNNAVNELFFWEHLTPPSVIVPGQGLKFDMDDVSIRNFGGGVAANNDDPLNIPSNVISTGQGFAIKAIANGTVNFTNSMRLTTGNTTLRGNEDEIDRLWLHIASDAYELGNNMLIGFNPEATAGIDTGYDTDRLACSVSIYSQLETGEERMAIQTREAFREDIKVPVGFSTLLDEDTSYTISLSQVEGNNLANRTIYLYDNELNVLTDLTQENYTFRSGFAAQDRRFTVAFEHDEEVLSTQAIAREFIAVYPNPTHGIVSIVSTGALLKSVSIFDLQGRQLSMVNIKNTDRYQLDISHFKAAIYFVEIATEQGIMVKRIIKK